MDAGDPIDAFVRRSPVLARFCSQNGWIDEASLEYEVRVREPGSVVLAIRFDEIVVKAAGCVGRRIPCFGLLRLRLGEAGEVRAAEAL